MRLWPNHLCKALCRRGLWLGVHSRGSDCTITSTCPRLPSISMSSCRPIFDDWCLWRFFRRCGSCILAIFASIVMSGPACLERSWFVLWNGYRCVKVYLRSLRLFVCVVGVNVSVLSGRLQSACDEEPWVVVRWKFLVWMWDCVSFWEAANIPSRFAVRWDEIFGCLVIDGRNLHVFIEMVPLTKKHSEVRLFDASPFVQNMGDVGMLS